VPKNSGAAPLKAGVKHVYRLDFWKNVDTKNPKNNEAHDHQNAFKNEQAQAVTFHALAKLVGGNA
jgi:cell fate (sporulation/competence/biofilm development) regulator YmcA (YheA/YmcA/DUF963 family)